MLIKKKALYLNSYSASTYLRTSRKAEKPDGILVGVCLFVFFLALILIMKNHTFPNEAKAHLFIPLQIIILVRHVTLIPICLSFLHTKKAFLIL